MNKLLYGSALVCIAASLTAAAAFAASNSKVTITVGNKSTGLPYNVADGVTAELPLSGDFFSLAGASSTSEYIEKEFTVTSVTGNLRPVDISLFLTAVSSDNPDYSAIDYYDMKVADSEGNYIYNTEDDGVGATTAATINLGSFNNSFSSESKKYTLYYRVSAEASAVIDKTEASKLKITVHATPKAAEAAASPATAAPNNGGSSAGTTVVPTAAPTAASAPTATAAAGELSSKTYVCGKDIKPGRYLVTGSAKVSIKDKDGNIIKEAIVSEGSLDNDGKPSKFVVSLSDGDVVTVTSLVPGTKAKVDFISTSPETSPSPSPKAAAADSSKSKTKATASATPAAKSTNPKTGDNSVAIPALIAVMLMSAGFIGALEFLKRRNIG